LPVTEKDEDGQPSIFDAPLELSACHERKTTTKAGAAGKEFCPSWNEVGHDGETSIEFLGSFRRMR
jgi:hypothetical protein